MIAHGEAKAQTTTPPSPFGWVAVLYFLIAPTENRQAAAEPAPD